MWLQISNRDNYWAILVRFHQRIATKHVRAWLSGTGTPSQCLHWRWRLQIGPDEAEVCVGRLFGQRRPKTSFDRQLQPSRKQWWHEFVGATAVPLQGDLQEQCCRWHGRIQLGALSAWRKARPYGRHQIRSICWYVNISKTLVDVIYSL